MPVSESRPFLKRLQRPFEHKEYADGRAESEMRSEGSSKFTLHNELWPLRTEPRANHDGMHPEIWNFSAPRGLILSGRAQAEERDS